MTLYGAMYQIYYIVLLGVDYIIMIVIIIIIREVVLLLIIN